MNLKKTVFLFFVLLLSAEAAEKVIPKSEREKIPVTDSSSNYAVYLRPETAQGIVTDSSSDYAVYLRPETAQGIVTDSSSDYAELSRVKLVTPYQTLARQTEKVPIGLWVTLQKGWHSYWQYPGESGKALSATWTLPSDGFVSHFGWPIPTRMNFGSLTNFVYKNHFLLISELSLSKKHSPVKITAQVEWLICKEVCIPMSQEVHLELPIDTKVKINSHWQNVFDKWSQQIPKVIKNKVVLEARESYWKAHVSTEQKLQLLDVLPLSKESFSTRPPRILSTNDYQHSFLIPPKGETAPRLLGPPEPPKGGTAPRLLGPPEPPKGETAPRLLGPTEPPEEGTVPRLLSPNNPPEGGTNKNLYPSASPLHKKISPANSFSALLIFSSVDSPSESALKEKKGFIYTFTRKEKNIFWFLLLAFLGGIILNFMPCVLPIVFLKFSNTLGQSGKKTPVVILGNLFYSAGVVFSFMLLAVILLFLKKGGASIGWGFQMQSPYFLLGIIFLFVLISFNFIGWFSVSMPSVLPFFSKEQNYFKHFLTGVLSTTAASPCTVPFMGAAMGYAFLGNAFQMMMVFLFLGLGLSFPYLLLSVFPGGIKYVPTPGKWSSQLKHFMAFPMLATSFWLIHLFNRQEPEHLLALLFSLLFLALGFWLLNNIKKRQWLIWFSRAIILAALIYPFFNLYKETTKNISSIQWEIFSLQKLKEIRSTGKNVFVNFTADWCLTCKFNERITFKNKKVVRLFTEKNIRALKGDWTNKNPEISAVLKHYNRSGIPFYLYFPSGSDDTSALVLPELLTPGLLLKHINKE